MEDGESCYSYLRKVGIIVSSLKVLICFLIMKTVVDSSKTNKTTIKIEMD